MTDSPAVERWVTRIQNALSDLHKDADGDIMGVGPASYAIARTFVAELDTRMTGWQPIILAPLDETRIDLWIPGRGRICNAFWRDNNWLVWKRWRPNRPLNQGARPTGCHEYSVLVDIKPTHWKRDTGPAGESL